MQHRRIIKQGPVVLATGEDGTMDPTAASSQGLFLADTRFLSRFKICLNGLDPVLLGSTEEILFEASYLLTNPTLSDIPARGLGILRKNRIEEGAVRISIGVVNWGLVPIEVDLTIEIEADFYDSFEARGVKRLQRGETAQPEATDDELRLRYVGLDRIIRETVIATKPSMAKYESNKMLFPVKLAAGERTSIELDIKLIEKAPEGVKLRPEPSIERVPKPPWFDTCSTVRTNNAVIEQIIGRSMDDLEVLLTQYEGCWVPTAGLPRFAVPFGRDCLMTALQTLVWNPHFARDALRFLATTQGKEENPYTYEQPGKIMHEMHTGELARLREIPFGLFYGSVDSTPLFLVLGAEYIRWTGDMELYGELKPSFEAAWSWIDKYGDIDGSGYVQYKAHTPPRMSTAALTVGLFNQGWKDSANSVVYSDGKIVTDHPVSLAEVQGDLYRALSMWADLCATMPGEHRDEELSHKLRARADALFKRFNDEFWMEDKKYYAMALDGHHRHVDSITSNPAECLWSRLIADEHAQDLAKTVLSDAMFSSWGIRTMANSEKAFNPFSYHNGSVWPFENALIAAGFKKYGLVRETQEVFDAMVDASLYFEYGRWPEVYCGVSRTTGGVLARQPDACRPQAWSAGAIFLFMQTILGIAPQPFANRVDLTPALPSAIEEIEAQRIQIAGAELSLRLVREGNAVLLEIQDNPAELDVVVHPATRNHGALTGPHLPAVSK